MPAAQLELTGETSFDRNAFVTSYVTLLFNDNAQVLNEGSLIDIRIANETGEFETETDADSELMLDANGQSIPIIGYSFVAVPAAMAPAPTAPFSISFREAAVMPAGSVQPS